MYSVIILSALCITYVSSAKIIGIFATPSFSHQVVFQPIWKELSLQGHNVTIITPNPLNDPTLTNLTEIDIGELSYGVWKNSKLPSLGVKEHSTIEELQEISKIYQELTEAQLEHEIFKNLIKNGAKEEYDLFLVEFLWPSMYAFKDVFNCPMVGIASLPIPTTTYNLIGMPNNPALNPDMIMPVATDLTFKERVTSAFTFYFLSLMNPLTLGRKLQKTVEKHFGPNIRYYRDIASEVSLVLVNGNMATQNIKPTVPQFVEISGIHLKPTKPLPKDLKAFLDGAKEGVIYFSLGSNVKSSLLPPERLQAFLKAFEGLPYKVLWKYETDEVPDLPENVFISKWLPQQDLLAHPNIKLFITQGGLQSTDETILNKVPVLIIPFFGDQRFNADMMVKNGGGLQMDFNKFTSEEMREKILTIINDQKYKESMTKLSSIAFDQPMTALEKSMWHINYILRHKGASHLQYKAKNLPFYQFYMLDVYAFFLVIATIAIMATLKALRTTYSAIKFLGKNLIQSRIFTGTKSKLN